MVESAIPLANIIWRAISGPALMGIGVLSLRGGPARPRGAFAFGLFSLAWGAQITIGNALSLLHDPQWAGAAYLLFTAALLVATYLLVEFAASQSLRGTRRFWLVVRSSTAAIAIAGSLLLVVAPELFMRVRPDGGIARGPLADPASLVQFLAFALALVVLFRAWSGSTTPRTSLRSATLLAGLAVYVSYTAGFYLVRYGGAVLGGTTATTAILCVAFAAMLALCLRLAWLAGRDSALRPTAAERRMSGIVVGALLVPGAWGVAEGALSITFLPQVSTQGLWRLVGVAIIAYGLARWRLADLPQRATRAAVTGAGAGAAAAGGIAAYGVGTLVATGPAVPAALGIAVAGMALLPGVRLARRIFARAAAPPDTGRDEALYGQRVDAYRAAIEASLARGTMEEDADFLAALRDRFGITESEDRLLRHYARACVIAPREGAATAAYDRLRLLGEGGAGRTWLARDRVRDRLVVLKEPLERWHREAGLREAVLREARLAARIRHPNVVAVEAVIEAKGAPVLVLEFAEGGSLAQHLRARGVLPWQEAVELTVQILRGVEAIHVAGIIHRDLKPSNVLLTAEGVPKISDFGIAIQARAAYDADRTMVEGTTLVGTYAYMAPEMRTGAIGTRQSDVFGVAAMLHEMLYGTPPGLLAPVLASNVVPPEVTAVLARALHADAAQRPPTARALAEELTTTGARARRL